MGVDVRRAGSGNIGATNVARTAGARLGVLTLVADAAKGALPVLIARRLGSDPALSAGVGFAAFLGHVHPITLGLAGGKGVATALGVLVVLCPPAVPWVLAAFVVVFAAWRYVSLASLGGAAAAPLAVGLLGCPLPSLVAFIVMGVLIAVRHRDNLRRLASGDEPRFAMHKKEAPLNK
jgi:glycerol-3-phosphate acyltransferase PlsY